MALALGVAACGGDGDDPAAASPSDSDDSATSTSDSDGDDGDGQGADSVDTLTIAAGGATSAMILTYLAEELGYAEEEGLDLTVRDVGANVLNLLVAGDWDLGQIGASTALTPIADGQSTTIVAITQKALSLGFVVGAEGIESVDQCTRVATGTIGSTTAAVTEAYKQATGASYEVIALGDSNQIVPSFASGQNDCALSTLGIVRPALDQGGELIVDPRNPDEVPSEAVRNAAAIALFGMEDNVADKGDAIVKLIRAMDRVEEYIRTTPALEMAEVLVQHEGFAGFEPEALAANIEADLEFTYPDLGYVTEEDWDATLDFYSSVMEQIDPADELWSYESRVDMSYQDEARG